jgi:two-component system sensor histidine kinase/response regulator
VLLDIRMPGMDGYELCRQFKADEALRSIPILFISALSAAEDIAAGFERGGVDYIAKPFRQSEVLARVRVHLALRAAYAGLAQAHTRLGSLERDRDLLTQMLVQDLRSPLREISRRLEILENEAAENLSEHNREGLSAAIHSTRRVSQMVSTVVYLRRMVDEGIPLHRRAVPAHEIFAAARAQTLDPAACHRITETIADTCPALLCDANLSELIVANLLANALKRAPDESRIVLGAEPDPGGVRIWACLTLAFVMDLTASAVDDSTRVARKLTNKGAV